MEELIAKKRKMIVDGLVAELGKENPDLYYTDSSTIASMVVSKIKDHELNAHDYELVKNLTPKDVLILMSFNSNCC